MSSTLKIGIIIPARMASERLPGKPLLDVLGLPMIEHVRRRALLSNLSENVLVASGDLEILNTVEKFGGVTVKTINEHLNGLSRVAEAVSGTDFTHIIILQGDEILILPDQLNSLISMISSNPRSDFWNGICSLESPEELINDSIVKCTQREDKTIQTIFRKSPFTTGIESQMLLVKKINGLFAISREFLTEIAGEPATPIEKAESIEQMRILELSKSITTFDMKKSYPSINLHQDIKKVLSVLSGDPNQSHIFSQIKNL
jgi:3-deoxy-manno-octulosonate cytidylyltransferase (CMP-KDO synthetase)